VDGGQGRAGERHRAGHARPRLRLPLRRAPPRAHAPVLTAAGPGPVRRHGRAFFDLQLAFARAAARLAGIPLERALLDYTNLYVRFGLGRDFDPGHPVWREYLAGLTDDPGAWTHAFYLRRPEASPPGLVATFGCFAYARVAPDRIRLHFTDADGDGESPLADAREGRRRAELAALVAHAVRHLSGDAVVVGASWLYNLRAYRRLFPDAYLATAQGLRGRFRHMPLWGQFVERRGEIRAALASRLLACAARRTTAEDLDTCFPLPVLAPQAPLSVFTRLSTV
jgi:hypothetical protein